MPDFKIAAGDFVAFNTMPDATWFEVVAIDGNHLTIREAGTDYAVQCGDRTLVKQRRPGQRPTEAEPSDIDLSALADTLLERARLQGWLKGDKWTAKGKAAAGEFLIGAASALQLTGRRSARLEITLFIGAARGDFAGEFLRAARA